MKSIELIILLGLVGNLASAQTDNPPQVRAANVMDRISVNGGVTRSDLMYGLPLAEGEKAGSYYFSNNWSNAAFELFDFRNIIKGYRARYDVKNSLIEIMIEKGPRVLSIAKIKSLTLEDSVTGVKHSFVNTKEFSSAVRKDGLAEVLVNGDVSLYHQVIVTIRRPDYVPALDMGMRDEKLILNAYYFVAYHGNVTELKNKNDLLDLLTPEEKDRLRNYIKANDLNLKKRDDLITLIELFNNKI